MRRPLSPQVENQQLQVQELVVRFEDLNLYSTSASAYYIKIGESCSTVVSVLFLDDSAGTIAPVQAANVSLVDSQALTPGGDNSTIKLASLSAPLAAHDSLMVQYITVN